MESSPADVCTTWISWSQYFVGETTEWVDYPAFVILAMSFVLLSAWLVKTFAKRAAGSGIPEMKTILGGFVMPHFLSGWTLLVCPLTIGALQSTGQSTKPSRTLPNFPRKYIAGIAENMFSAIPHVLDAL